MPKTIREFKTKHVSASSAFRGFSDYSRYFNVQFSNMKTIYDEEISGFISTGNATGFKSVLRSEYISPNCIKKRFDGVSGSTGTRVGGGSSKHVGYVGGGGCYLVGDEYQSHYVRPVVEELFFEHNDAYQTLIHKIRVSDHSKALYQSLVDSLQNTDLSEKTLFEWNDTIKRNIVNQVSSLKKYGEKLQSKNVEKGSVAIALSEKIRSILDGLDHINEPESHLKALHIVEVKLQLIKTLHSMDSLFGVHRGHIKQILANIVSIIITGGLANLIHKAVKGDWLFFNQTTTQQKISDIDASFGSAFSLPNKF